MPWVSGFAGADNFARMGGDPRFWSSLWLTLIYTGTTVVLQVAIGLALALLVLQIPRGQSALRVAAILSIVLAPVVVGLFWRTFVLSPDFGLVDLVTRAFGLGSHNWLGDPQLALISVIAIHTWQWTPFAFLVMLASLASLPPDIFEAARIDRASAWQRFRRITLPLIRPAIVIVLIMRTMVALSAFPSETGTTALGTDWLRAPLMGVVDQLGHHVPTWADHVLRVYVGITGGGTFRTEDGGATWMPRNTGVAADFLPSP